MKKSGENQKMFKKIFKFLKGYVIIKIVGKNREKLANMLVHNGVDVGSILPSDDSLILELDMRDFLNIRRLAKKCGVRVSVISKQSLRRWLRKYRLRPGFPIAGIIVGIFFLVVPHFVWSVEIEGAYGVDTERVEEILREHGVYVGARKSGIDELREIKNAIVYGVDGVNWAWLYIEGARARLQLQAETPAPAVDDRMTPTDIIAGYDGFVVRADIMSGERRVNTGMNVMAGDVLASGKVPTFREGYPESYMFTHAQGRIIADTIRYESGSFSAKETLRIKTGNTRKRLSVELFGRRLDLFRDISCGFNDYDFTEQRYDWDIPFIGYTGISVTVHEIHEINIFERELSEDEVLSRAKEQLEERICRRLMREAVKQEEKLTYNADGDSYKVELRMRFRENIGIEVPIEE